MRGAWLCWALVGCAGAGPAGGPDAGPDASAVLDGGRDAGAEDRGSFDAAAPDTGVPTIALEAARMGELECSFAWRCREREVALRYRGDRPACVAAESTAWRERLTVQADRVGEAGLEWSKLDACRAALVGGPCYAEPHDLGGPCASNLLASVELGGPCFDGIECRSGVCVTTSPGVACGRCGEPVAQDDSCVDGVTICAPDTACDGRTCKYRAAVGERCVGACRGYLDCTIDFEGTLCLPPLADGEICTRWPRGEGPHCADERNLACIDERTCEVVQWADPGAPCDARHLCRPTRWQNRCVGGTCSEDEPVQLDGACTTDDACVLGAYCATVTGTIGRCASQLANGACSSARACAPPLECLGGSCRARTWRRCP